MNMQSKLGQLFSFISQNPKLSLTKIFMMFAKKWALSRDSVRNIYYQNYSKVLSDDVFCEKFAINKNNFKKNNSTNFTEEEKNWLLKELDFRLKAGYSLRKACLEIAGGDVGLMVRYLNKYRSLTKNNTVVIDTKILAPKKERITKFNPLTEKENPNKDLPSIESKKTQDKLEEVQNSSKIIKMPEKADVLSEKDIQSLFLGLIRLVKNNTIKEMNFALNEKYKEKITEIYALKHNLSLLTNKLEEEKRLSSKLQIELNLLKSNKLEEYGEFMKKLNSDEYKTEKKLN